jgi:hypothetical protein
MKIRELSNLQILHVIIWLLEVLSNIFISYHYKSFFYENIWADIWQNISENVRMNIPPSVRPKIRPDIRCSQFF